MTLRVPTLVLGRGGLVGSAVAGALTPGCVVATTPFTWRDPSLLSPQLDETVRSLVHTARVAGTPWLIYWCAGVGHPGSDQAALDRDTDALFTLLGSVEKSAGEIPGAIVMASSAGGLYAGARSWPADERTPVAPVNLYGEAKLRQEEALRATVMRTPGLRGTCARLSNVYGPAQDIEKAQGLISQIVANTLRGKPSSIHVPLDTTRDYLYESDAGRLMAALGAETLELPGGTVEARVVAAEEGYSIPRVMGVVSRVMKRRVPYLATTSPSKSTHPAVLSFRSINRQQRTLVRVSLEEGIAKLLTAYR